MFSSLAFALKKTLSSRRRRGKNKFLTQVLGLVVEVVDPKSSTVWNVEKIPVVVSPTLGSPIPTALAYRPGKPVRPYSYGGVMRNGSPVSDAEFRAIAGLPVRRRADFPPPEAIKQFRKSKMLEEFSRASMLLILANLRRAAEDDGIPILLDSDPIDWNTAAAAEAARIAGAAISRAAL
jgi:hypothetical protein